MTETDAAVRKYAGHSTRELLAVNATYLREYRDDPTPGRLAAVNDSSRALSARGA